MCIRDRYNLIVIVPTTGGSLYDTIVVTSEADVTRYHPEAVSGHHELVVLDKEGCTSIGNVNVTVCNFCYGYHYVAYDLAGKELSEDELGFDSLADAIRCLLEESDVQLPTARSSNA